MFSYEVHKDLVLKIRSTIDIMKVAISSLDIRLIIILAKVYTFLK